MDQIDEKLIELLRLNAREPTASLARKLNLSRSTVQDRIARLIDRNIISGFTVRFHGDYQQKLITAHVMICITQRHAAQAIVTMRKHPAIRTLYVVSGVYDMIAIIKAPTMEEIDKTLDDICAIEGVEKTTTSLVLSTKIDR
ncbi:Lrp/AsnC family transcriptional regulator [Luteithermobacter gelatinilyticus]|uniref:Lrp/AsnC family transcriptional regulator n=1 Tax=Luteithermobacter gelatinilyticus TaxID=2582913 RepID=UPI00110614B7|nr:Lrp/AsnC family transcriptional regulator [Luteithermobacter gelatinilyticus]|tara:strand:+ start:8053 stop:8478 length:426 start_codon:yes stop_codon:yes gene_type:complete